MEFFARRALLTRWHHVPETCTFLVNVFFASDPHFIATYKIPNIHSVLQDKTSFVNSIAWAAAAVTTRNSSRVS
jgi:hypothetical protein